MKNGVHNILFMKIIINGVDGGFFVDVLATKCWDNCVFLNLYTYHFLKYFFLNYVLFKIDTRTSSLNGGWTFRDLH